jgi:hypothetical protein
MNGLPFLSGNFLHGNAKSSNLPWTVPQSSGSGSVYKRRSRKSFADDRMALVGEGVGFPRMSLTFVRRRYTGEGQGWVKCIK